jgi:hypothetical protein
MQIYKTLKAVLFFSELSRFFQAACKTPGLKTPHYSTTIRFLFVSKVWGPIPGTLRKSSGSLKGPLASRNSIITAAFFSPTPLSCVNSSADAVLMFTFGESSAHAAVKQAKTKTTTIVNEIWDWNLHILYLR